jgi:hypothetical protein
MNCEGNSSSFRNPIRLWIDPEDDWKMAIEYAKEFHIIEDSRQFILPTYENYVSLRKRGKKNI